MKLLLIAMVAALGMAGVAQAKKETKRTPASRVHYAQSCQLVDDFDSWHVRVGNQQADFFDNDHNCIRGFSKTTAAMRIYSRQIDCKGDNFTFAWNKEAMTGELRFPEQREIGGKKRSSVKLKCTAESEVEESDNE